MAIILMTIGAACATKAVFEIVDLLEGRQA